MPQPQNPLAAPLGLLKQFGEQANLSLAAIGTGLSQTASQGLDMLMGLAPPLPGMPGGSSNPGNPLPQLPTPQQLLPANLLQPLSQLENLVLPAGMPRLSQLMRPAAAPERPAVDRTAETPPAVVTRQRVPERRGM